MAKQKGKVGWKLPGDTDVNELLAKCSVRFALASDSTLDVDGFDVQLSADGSALRIAELSGAGILIEPVASNVILVRVVDWQERGAKVK